MSKINDGGPAFPVCNEANVNGTMGMTMRDWFAGQALVGMGTWCPANPKGYYPGTPEGVRAAKAAWAFATADAMLLARRESGQ